MTLFASNLKTVVPWGIKMIINLFDQKRFAVAYFSKILFASTMM